MPDQEEASTIRQSLTPEQRSADLRLTIDPGFVHYSKIQTLLGPAASDVDEVIRQLPSLPDWQHKMRVAHVYRDALLLACKTWDAPSLGDLLAAGRGTFFCSTVAVQPTPDVYSTDRAITRIIVPGVDSPKVELHYSTRHFIADTIKSELANGDESIAVVAEFHRKVGDTLIFYPLLMGAPWLGPGGDREPFPALEWYSHDFFEHFVEDIDEFDRVRATGDPQTFDIMSKVTESAFKACLAEILGDSTRADWGGEMSDHFATHLHLSGKRTTAAFVLKGPGNGFRPMTLKNLGKNSDQIYRLAQEPAQMLVVQHCHEITAPVRATLRAFAVQPGRPRRYCLLDGRDSLRLLLAYGKLERALELSGSPSS